MSKTALSENKFGKKQCGSRRWDDFKIPEYSWQKPADSSTENSSFSGKQQLRARKEGVSGRPLAKETRVLSTETGES